MVTNNVTVYQFEVGLDEVFAEPCHPVVVIDVKKLNHVHKNHSFHTQSDF